MKENIEAASNDKANLETSMTEELDKLSHMSSSRCIFRVPDRLRRVCKEAYTPRVISIGPLHHGKKDLKAMEEHKRRYLKYFLEHRTNNLLANFQHNLSLKGCIKKIRDKEQDLRCWYSETINCDSDEFVRIILVDAIFIIEFLIRHWRPRVQDENDCIFGVPQMALDIQPDLMMLENQLPFFILKDLFDELNVVDEMSLLDLSCNFVVGACSSTFREKMHNLERTNSSEVKHFVDLLRKLCIAPILKEVKEQSEGESIPATVNQSLCLSFLSCPQKKEKQYKDSTTPSVSKLHLAGVQFKVRRTNNLFDIKFINGILYIPELKTEDFTELILRNLIAFEQCTFDKHYISDYVSIMDEFLDTPKDVELLVKYGIVENILGGGDDELSTMINSLSTGVVYDPSNFCYGTLCKELNKFCSSKCNKRIANLRQKYFNTPWATISFGAAVILLILTVIQTFCSVMSISS